MFCDFFPSFSAVGEQYGTGALTRGVKHMFVPHIVPHVTYLLVGEATDMVSRKRLENLFDEVI